MPITVTRAGQSYGPYSLEDLHRYVASGNILPTDLAVSDDLPQPRTVAEFLATNGAAMPPTSLPPAAWDQPQQPIPYPAAQLTQYPWFPVSTVKFVVMSLCTFGIYILYWTYKQWRRLDPADALWITCVRTIFSGITNFSLFSSVKTRADLEGDRAAWNPILLAILVIFLGLLSRVHFFPALPPALGILGLFLFLPYIPVLGTMARMNARHATTTGVSESPNSSFSGINILGIVVGGIILLLALIGFAAQILGLVKR